MYCQSSLFAHSVFMNVCYLKFVCNSVISTAISQSFIDMHRMMKCWSLLTTQAPFHICGWATSWLLPSCFQLLYCKQMSSLHSYLVPRFLHFCAFWWFYCRIWPSSIVLKLCLMFLNSRRLWCTLWRKYMYLITFV